MIPVLVERAAEIMQARIEGESGEGEITGVTLDSRTVTKGDMFVALKGNEFDGHDFIAEASEKGATCVLSTRAVADETLPQIVASSTFDALAKLAAWVRESCDPLVIGITGSFGKTTTKDLLAAIASQDHATVWPRNSFNNELGAPMTLMSMNRATEFVICEMAARAPGQIKEICDYARPAVGVVTNVGISHLGEFGSVEAIAQTKGELIESLPESGAAILNADDELVMSMKARTGANILTWGQEPSAFVRLHEVRVDDGQRAIITISCEGRNVTISLPFVGPHLVPCALAASTAALAMGLDLDECRRGLERATLSKGRMTVHKVRGGLIVDDAYNSNPTSLLGALRTCKKLAGDGRLTVVLGYMAELGEETASEHQAAGERVAELCNRLIVVGKAARDIGKAARGAGMTDVVEVGSVEDVTEAVLPLTAPEVVLVKGPRSMAMERAAEALVKELAER